MTTERFDRAYNSLVKAYFDGDLKAGDCEKCAVSSIVGDSYWKYLFITSDGNRVRVYNTLTPVWDGYERVILNLKTIEEYKDRLLKETDYTWLELAQVELAFERNTNSDPSWYFTEQGLLEDQFKGLLAVVDVLLKLDNIQEGQQYKDKFKEHPKLQLA